MSRHESDLHDEHISRLYKMGSQATPSAELDGKIKQAAHKAVTTQRLSPGWRYSATAAVLMLCIGVILEIFDITPPQQELAPEPAMAPAQFSDSEAPGVQEPAAGKSVEAKPKRSQDAVSAARPQAEQKKQEQRSKSILMEQQSRQAMPAKPVLGLAPGTEERFLEKEADDKTVAADALAPDCARFSYPETADKAAWIALANKLRMNGELEYLECLEQRFRRSHGESLEE